MKLHIQGVWQNADKFVRQLAYYVQCSVLILRVCFLCSVWMDARDTTDPCDTVSSLNAECFRRNYMVNSFRLCGVF